MHESQGVDVMCMADAMILFDNNRQPKYLVEIINAYKRNGLLRQDIQNFRWVVADCSVDSMLYMIRTQCDGDRVALEKSFISLCREAEISGV